VNWNVFSESVAKLILVLVLIVCALLYYNGKVVPGAKLAENVAECDRWKLLANRAIQAAEACQARIDGVSPNGDSVDTDEATLVRRLSSIEAKNRGL
jgi:hypothetical protein